MFLPPKLQTFPLPSRAAAVEPLLQLSKCVLLRFPTWLRGVIPARGAEARPDYH